MNIKKRAFTLLEVMISLVLVGILLSFLFSFFRQTLAAKGQAKVLKEKIMQRELFQLRLNQFFMRSAKEKKGVFSTIEHANATGSGLLLAFDQGADPDPTFCGTLHGMLYKTGNRVCICTWAHNHLSRVDTLLENVKEFSLSFFDGEEWKSVWQPKDGSLPVMIKACVQFERVQENLHEFIFFLHPTNAQISYEQEVPK